MRYLALATDFDGTLAHDGRVDRPTLAALDRLRASGRRLLLVTGRELNELLGIFSEIGRFDRVVAENGALLYDPTTEAARGLAPPPPTLFLDDLRRRGVPFTVGRSIVSTVEPHQHAVLAAIQALGLEWHIIFNKGSVMALPSVVTKATGLESALKELNIAADQVVGVGDAENDHAFLRRCGLSAAVSNALPSLIAAVDLVTAGHHGAGVTELIDGLLADDLSHVKPSADHHDRPAL